MTSPYEADPAKIPTNEMYADVLVDGRYYPKNDDFRVDFQHVNSQTIDSLRYWALVVRLCTEEIWIYPADEGGRDGFALGSVIVKSNYLHAREGTQCTEIDYTYADANEIIANASLSEKQLQDMMFWNELYDMYQRIKPGLSDSHMFCYSILFHGIAVPSRDTFAF